MSTARTFTICHGETEWSRTYRQTGITDLDLTQNGTRRIIATGKAVVGKDKLISPEKTAHVYVHLQPCRGEVTLEALLTSKSYCSPRQRARKTLELLNLQLDDNIKLEITNNLQEWDCGDYEGLTVEETKERMKAKGLDKDNEWEIRRDGCEGGE